MEFSSLEPFPHTELLWYKNDTIVQSLTSPLRSSLAFIGVFKELFERLVYSIIYAFRQPTFVKKVREVKLIN
jgi:hypothetical protein